MFRTSNHNLFEFAPLVKGCDDIYFSATLWPLARPEGARYKNRVNFCADILPFADESSKIEGVPNFSSPQPLKARPDPHIVLHWVIQQHVQTKAAHAIFDNFLRATHGQTFPDYLNETTEGYSDIVALYEAAHAL